MKKQLKEQEDFHYSEDRDSRVKDTGEVFTPDNLVQDMLDRIGVDWSNPPQTETFLDPTCGTGAFLTALAKRGIPINMIYGVELMPDNVAITKQRLSDIFLEQGMNIEDIQYHLDRNIVCADALTYHFNFHEHNEEGISKDEW